VYGCVTIHPFYDFFTIHPVNVIMSVINELYCRGSIFENKL